MAKKDATAPINEANTDALALALFKAQSAFTTAHRYTDNPYFKSKYVSFGTLWELVVKPLADNGLFILQPIQEEDGKIYVETLVMHISGRSFSSRCPVLVKAPLNPQAMGSAVTYARRYALAALLGVVIDDDDGNNAAGHNQTAAAPKGAKPTPTTRQPITPQSAATLADAIAAIRRAKTPEELVAIYKGYAARFGIADTFNATLKSTAQELEAKQ